MSLPAHYNTQVRSYQTWDSDSTDYRNENITDVTGFYDTAVWAPKGDGAAFNTLNNALVKYLDGSYRLYFNIDAQVILTIAGLPLIDLSTLIPEKLASFQSIVMWQQISAGPILISVPVEFRNGDSTLEQDKILTVFNANPGGADSPDVLLIGVIKLFPRSFFEKFITP